MLKLGIKDDTADLSLYYVGSLAQKHDWKTQMFKYSLVREDKVFEVIYSTNLFPAWSLGKLLSMCNETIKFGRDYIVCAMDFEKNTHNGFDGIIDCIEWLISKNMFNKNYLTK